MKIKELIQQAPRITHLSGFGNYTYVHFLDNRRVLITYTLSHCLDKLPGFIRVHRKYGVNPLFIIESQISRDDHKQAHLNILGQQIPISRRMQQTVMAHLFNQGFFSSNSKTTPAPWGNKRRAATIEMD
jgi:DNA-binding LytR/AlgR family response regulator